MGVVIPPRSIALDLDPAHARVFGDPTAARGAPRGWDFLGNVPVPLRARARDDLAEVVTRHRAEAGVALKCCLPMGQGGRGPLERLRWVRDLDDFPHMLVSAEHGNAFNRRFHDTHVVGGAFTGCQPEGVAPAFAEAGLVDPKGWIGTFAVAPFVWLIDRRRLGERPMPRRWADLADPAYRGEVVFGGWRREGAATWSAVNTFFLLAMLRRFGPDGLSRIVANVPGLMHSAQMPRFAGTDASMGAIYVLPWSLAALCPRRTHTDVVWPEDGALAYPLWTTVKNAHRDRLDVLVRHVHGAATADWLDRNRYPALAPGRVPALPQGARLDFLGWDYLRHRATAGDIRRARAIFDAHAAAGSTAKEEARACA